MDVSGSLVACALLLLATEVICNSVLFVGGITMETCKTHLISENLFTLVSILVCICVIGVCCCHCCQGNMQRSGVLRNYQTLSLCNYVVYVNFIVCYWNDCGHEPWSALYRVAWYVDVSGVVAMITLVVGGVGSTYHWLQQRRPLHQELRSRQKWPYIQ